ncbi:replication licensing factor Cdt1 [Dissophora globulifera]|uniref:Replication licensing factor Cdt1 n=1 Tax=Dissophora globulifera TaxID=979702 RepID=A0A9P6RSB8_9FUNG|nr:replication licensing factor Cdt1 [Dissophora globulifera]
MRTLHSKRGTEELITDVSADPDAIVSVNNKDGKAKRPNVDEQQPTESDEPRPTTETEKQITGEKEHGEHTTARSTRILPTRSTRSATASRTVRKSSAITIPQTTLKITKQTSAGSIKTQRRLDFISVSARKVLGSASTNTTVDVEAGDVSADDASSGIDKEVEPSVEVPTKASTVDTTASNIILQTPALVEPLTVHAGEALSWNAHGHRDGDNHTPLETADAASTTANACNSNNNEKTDSSDNEDNIHPLARTVVTVAERPHRAVTEVDRPSTGTTIRSRNSLNGSSKIFRQAGAAHETIVDKPLPLPTHLRALHSIFEGLEEVMALTKAQGRHCFYHKLKRNVELQSSRNFDIKHLAQIKTILPEVYQLTSEPCLHDGKKIQSIKIDTLGVNEGPTPSFIPQGEVRKKLFIDRLIDHVQKHHQVFLISSTPARMNPYPLRWHPDFNLETVPEIDEAEMPLRKPTVVDVSNVDIRSLGRQREYPQQGKQEAPSFGSTVSVGDTKTGSVLSSLDLFKERVRRNQEMRQQTTGPTPLEKREALTASRLRWMFNVIEFKRVEVTPIASLVRDLVRSARSPTSEEEAKEGLEAMTRVLPEWCDIITLATGVDYFRIKEGKHDSKGLRTRLAENEIAKKK